MATEPQEMQVAAVGCFNSEGKLLLGLRNDYKLWTSPAGKLEPGERPERGAVRELYEEAGIEPNSLIFLGDGLCKLSEDQTVRVFCFRAEIADGQNPTGANDPDQECTIWRWVDVSLGSLPMAYEKALYSPNNVLLKFLDLQRGVIQSELTPPGEDDIKVIIEQSGMAPMPIEGSTQYVYMQLLRRFPALEDKAEPGDAEGLAVAINESEAAYVSFGEELNDPRHVYKNKTYVENEIEDPWTVSKESRKDF